MPIAEATEAQQGVHLVILHHGLWGNKDHVKFLAQQFKKRFGDRILVYRAESNESSLTYDGVDICAQRAVQEIHEVIHVVESGGNISELRGQKGKNKNKKKDIKKKKSTSSTQAHQDSDSSSESNVSNFISRNNSQLDLPSGEESTQEQQKLGRVKRVTQFSFLGYSLGGLIGRFVVGLLDMEKFFDPVSEGGQGVEPMYFVTMATPHLGIRKPPDGAWSKWFNYASANMLSRSGEQMQLVDDYVDGKPLLLVMSEPEGVFVKALERFKRRALYCNIRNDRSVPFWTASFSDADPFTELDSLEIRYTDGYSSLIESFEHHDLETLTRLQEERAASLKAATFSQRTSQTLANIPWKRYALFGVLGPFLIPLWVVFATTTIGYQGMSSRRRTKNLISASQNLKSIREKVSTVKLERYRDDDDDNDHGERQDNTHTQDTQDATVEHAVTNTKGETGQEHTTVAGVKDSSSSSSSSEETVVSYSYPDLKSVKPLALLPVQVEISRNLNKLEWKKNIVHIDAWNSHATIVMRQKRFHNEGGEAIVKHAVEMFKEDGQDE